ncbi:response regulator [Massilia sp. PWRC2]|uniref:response regulator n=1 Tax=Massilia sp. PWRC2 TaxID=2804626 RepID=UPI003CE92EDA
MLDAVSLATMAALSTNHDWSRSAVGAPASWPSALRLTVDIMLNTPLPMLLCWGPQRAVLFNGAYAALAGAGHPAAPGGNVPALLPVPLAAARDSVDQAFSGVATHLRRRSLQFAGSALAHEADLHFTPLLQDDGAVGGVLCALAPPTAAAATSAGAAAGSALRILVVEDNLDSQFLVCEMLSAFGHDNAGVAHAEGALQLLDGGNFNVLFTDVSLPGMSGVELARRARARDPSLRVIFASGYGDALLRQIEFPYLSLQKPYEIEQLQNALAAAAASV